MATIPFGVAGCAAAAGLEEGCVITRAAIAFGLLAAAREPAPAVELDESGKAAYQALASSPGFTIGVHDEKQPFKEEPAMRLLLKHPDKAQVFSNLLKEASAQARLYGLLGLMLADRKTFEAQVGPYLLNEQEILVLDESTTIPAEIVWAQRSVRSVAEWIRRGYFDEFLGAVNPGQREKEPGDPVNLGGLDALERSAYQTIKEAIRFGIGGFGAAGTITEPEKALHVLLKHGKCSELFQNLLKEAGMPGQLYALLGLKRADPKAFESMIRPYLFNGGTVQVFQGCVVTDLPVRSMAREIERGDYDEWFKQREAEPRIP